MKLKNIISLILSVLLVFAATIPAGAEETLIETGAWEINQGNVSVEENTQAIAALNKALEQMDGAAYEPVAVLGTQVVAGTNYCILCKVTPVVPDAVAGWMLVYVYEDIEGNAAITNTSDLMTAAEDGMTGAWEPNQGDEALEADARTALTKSLEETVGADYEVIACLGSQVVAGTNYCLLCRVAPVIPDAQYTLCLVTVYQDLEGNAELTDVQDLVVAGDVVDTMTQNGTVNVDNREEKANG